MKKAMSRHHQKVYCIKRQKGISNIQIMVGVLISAILILGGIGLIRYIDKAKVNNDLNELTELKARTIAYGTSHGGNFAFLTQELAIGLEFFPKNRISGPIGSKVILNQWKGNVTVEPIQTYTPNDSVLYNYFGVPASACKELVMRALDLTAVVLVNGSFYAKKQNEVFPETTIISGCEAAGDNATIGYVMTN